MEGLKNRKRDGGVGGGGVQIKVFKQNRKHIPAGRVLLPNRVAGSNETN